MGDRLRKAVQAVELQTRALYLAARDPRVPVSAKIVAGLVVAYALSPIDLIPDFIPVLGYLDDLVLVPLGIALVVRLIPRDVWRECLDAARARMDERLRRNWVAGVFVIVVWVAAGALIGFLVWRRFHRA